MEDDSNLINQSERRRREVTMVRNGMDNMSPPRFESKGDFIIVVDLDQTLVYSQQVSGPETRPAGLNDSYITV